MSIAIALLESLLDTKELSHADKNVARNILIPALEYIESADNPRERMIRAYHIVGLLAIPIGLAIDSSLQQEAHNRIALKLSEKLYKEALDIASMLQEKTAKIAKMNQID